jgi:hypothetical protein
MTKVVPAPIAPAPMTRTEFSDYMLAATEPQLLRDVYAYFEAQPRTKWHRFPVFRHTLADGTRVAVVHDRAAEGMRFIRLVNEEEGTRAAPPRTELLNMTRTELLKIVDDLQEELTSVKKAFELYRDQVLDDLSAGKIDISDVNEEEGTRVAKCSLTKRDEDKIIDEKKRTIPSPARKGSLTKTTEEKRGTDKIENLVRKNGPIATADLIRLATR